MNSKAAPQPKYLKDYKAPDFKVNSIYLDFNINPGATIVTSKIDLTKSNPDAMDLVLNGEDLSLKFVKMNGKELDVGEYETDNQSLIIKNVGDAFIIETCIEIRPEENLALEGLYKSGINYCTQCEPEGFRHITYHLDRPDVMTKYTVRIEADKTICPILLSNGNCINKGDLEGNRHFTVWEDPFVKPSYLFALVAGDLAFIHDTFTTMSGKKVDLYIYVDHGNENRCGHAMLSLKNAMKWDEEKYGREYDLNIFNIVAVNDFNFGAMENKSLNVFNAKLVLADQETATDADFMNIEGVIAHEYFHNWTGDRITCRDWFQLSLKEGLTVFRDQSFSADMNSEAVQRIQDVNMLRTAQFAEDASPMAHPIRPESYIEMNNFYTTTVYEKGAEVIRMYRTLLGKDRYRKATDLYFARHDGQAVTCEDFIKCMEDGGEKDLSQFRLWYSQAGTPNVKVTCVHDAYNEKFIMDFEQSIPDTAGQTDKKPMHIPMAVGLLDRNGYDILSEKTKIIELTEAKQQVVFEGIKEKPVPSILRDFSAPVKLETNLTENDLLFLMANDTDGFTRWDAGQMYLQRLILSNPKAIPEETLEAFYKLITSKTIDKSSQALSLALPSEHYLAQLKTPIEVENLHDSRKFIYSCVAHKYLSELEELYRENSEKGDFSLSVESVGKRSLKNTALAYIYYGDPDLANHIAFEQYEKAKNMTDKVAALNILAKGEGELKHLAFETFYNQWKGNNLVIDKWFAIQAGADRKDAPEVTRELLQHPDFTYKNPNRLRSLIGTFAGANHRWFHRADGEGYKLLADSVLTVNDINPNVAARILTPFKQWKNYDSARKSLMQNELKRILSYKDICNDVYEIVSKSLD